MEFNVKHISAFFGALIVVLILLYNFSGYGDSPAAANEVDSLGVEIDTVLTDSLSVDTLQLQ